MLFKNAQIDGIRRGAIQTTYRRWKSPRARTGAVYRLRSGVAIRITRIVHWTKTLDARDAEAAGCASLAGLEALLGPNDPTRVLYRIEFELAPAPDDERARLAAARPTQDVVEEIRRRLDAMDARSKVPWTHRVLELIAAAPGRRAADLAAELGWDTPDLKARVRRLKAMGLTQSLEVGYRSSPRGRRYLSARASGWCGEFAGAGSTRQRLRLESNTAMWRSTLRT